MDEACQTLAEQPPTRFDHRLRGRVRPLLLQGDPSVFHRLNTAHSFLCDAAWPRRPPTNMAPAAAVLVQDLLCLLLPHLTRQDAAKLALACTAAAAACKASNALTTPAPRLVVCCSQSQKVLEVCLTPSGERYLRHQLPDAQAAATGRSQSPAARQPGLLPPCHVYNLKRG